MSKHSSFWTPKTPVALAIPFLTFYCLFEPDRAKIKAHEDKLTTLDKLPCLMRPLYCIGGMALVVIAIPVSLALFGLALSASLVHDAIIGIGKLINCHNTPVPEF